MISGPQARRTATWLQDPVLSEGNFSNLRLWVLILISTLVLYFIFAPAITMSYYAGDAYRYSFGGIHQSCSADDGFFFMKTLGRPIQAYLDCFSFKFAYNLENMQLIRVGTVILMGIGAGLFADFLYTLGLPLVSSLCIAGCIFVMQRFSDDTIITAATSLPVAIIFVMLATRMLNRVSDKNVFNRHITRHDLFWLAFAGISLFCAMLSYPAMGFFFVVVCLSRLVFSNLADWTATRRKLFLEVAFFCGICVLFFIYSSLNMRFNQQAPVPPQYHLDHPNIYPLELIKRILTLANLKNPIWKLFYWSNIAVQTRVALIILASGAVAGLTRFFRGQFFNGNKSGALSALLQALFSLCLLLLLSNAFYLLIPDLSILELRVLFTTLSAGLILIFWSLFQICNLVPKKISSFLLNGLLCLCFIMLANTQNKYLMVRALSLSEYYHYNQALFLDYLTKGNTLQRVHFVVDHSTYPYNKFFLTNAILRELTGKQNDNLKWCSLPRGVEGREADHQKEVFDCLDNLPMNGIAVTYSYDDEPYKLTKNTLLITTNNMSVGTFFNEFYRQNYNEKMKLVL